MLKNLVSIIIPTYNCGRYIKEAVDSCLIQTYSNVEIIVIDDGSTDNTKEILQPYICEERIVYIFQTRMGRSYARNIGIKLCRGEFIQFLDSDDIIEKTKIEKQVKFLLENTNIQCVYCKSIYFKNNDKNDIVKEFIIKKHGNLYKYLIIGNFITINSVLFRKGNFYFDETLETMEDWDYWLNVSLNGNEFSYIDDKLCYVRIHSNNTTHNKKLMLKNEKRVLKKILNNRLNLYSDIINFRLFMVSYILNEDDKKYYINEAINQIKNIYLVIYFL